VYAEDGIYEYISIVDREYNGVPGRMLFLDRSASSGITLPDGKLLFKYAFFNNLYGFFNEKLNNALVLGAGTGSLAKDVSEKYPNATIDIVDIEPKLFYLSHKYFQVPTSSKIVEHVGDGRQFLRRSDVKYDFIFGDMYSSLYSAPWHVMTKEYYESVWNHLNDNGVYIGNYIAAIDLESPLLDATIQTLSEVFEEIYVFAVTSPDISTVQNIIIIAIKNNTTGKHITVDELEKSDNDIIRGFADKLILDKLTSSKNRVLTDDLAPVELYSAKLIGSINTAE
jgi:spermidine synthase